MENTIKRPIFSLVLIHNNNEERYKHIRPALEKLSNKLSEKFETVIIEPSFRPEIIKHSKMMTFKREVMYFNLNQEWVKYRLLEEKANFKDRMYFYNTTIKKNFFNKKSKEFERKRRNSYRETVLTENHIEGWSASLALGAEYLIIFEDDAVFEEKSIERIISLFEYLINKADNSPIFVDLAGGCEYNELKVNYLEREREDNFIHYIKPVTNTACCYLLNKALTIFFLENIFHNPNLRLIGADWLMNKLFILADKKGVKCRCMHSSPTIFKHGSVTGEYSSLLSPDRLG